jgi:hypothetical protein
VLGEELVADESTDVERVIRVERGKAKSCLLLASALNT